MATFARRIVSVGSDGDLSDMLIDYQGASVPTAMKRPEYEDRQPTPAQRIRRRHRAWMFLVDSGLQTYQEIADGHGVTVQAVYYGVRKARERQRRIRHALEAD